MLPLQTFEQRKAILDLLQTRGRGVDAIGVVAEEVREILELRFDRVARIQIRTELRIDVGQFAVAKMGMVRLFLL